MIQETDIIPEYLILDGSHASPKAYLSILKMFLNNKKLRLFHLCSMKTGLPRILKRRLNYLTHFLLNSAL